MTEMANVPIEHGLMLSAALFVLGFVGLVVRRNILYMLMSVEIMLNAAGTAFIVASSRWEQPDGQIMYMIILTMAAAEVAVALALVLRFYRQFQTLDVDSASTMKG